MNDHVRPFWGIRPWRRHSLVLLVAGFAYIAVGISYILSKPTFDRKHALVVALHWLPMQFWGSVFVLVGIGSIISSRWPPVAEKWGYIALTGFSAGWSATYAMGIVFENSPISNVASVIIWGLMAFLWWAISGLVNPEDVVVSANEQLDSNS